jgi:perosamine synthetase
MKFRIKQIEPTFDNKEKELVNKVLDSTFITEGKVTEKFENQIKKVTNAKYAVAVNNWTSGLFCCAKSLELKPGDEIIIPNATFAACVSSMILAGLKILLCDVSKENYSLDLKMAEQLISKKTKAIMIVHLFGECSEIDKIKNFAKKHNLKIIEDSAQSFGSKYKNKQLGTFGDVGGFSFYGNKIITTGEGGVAITNNKLIAKRIKKIKNYGRSSKGVYEHETVGYNFKFNDICASIGLAQLSKLKSFIVKKKLINNFYRKEFKKIDKIKFSKSIKNSEPVYWFVVIYVNDKKKLKKYLQKNGIETRDFFLPMNMQKCFKNSKFIINKNDNFLNSKELYKTGLCLPSSVNLDMKQLRFISSTIKKYYEYRG